MRNRLIAAAVSAVAVGATAIAVVPAATAATAPSAGGTCSLSGTANFNSPLFGGPTATTFTYSFTGTLSSCDSNVSGAPSGGTIEAGVNGLPVPTGSGSCAQSDTAGTAVINWSDGKTTVVSYSTKGAAAAVGLGGSVIASVTATNGTTTTTYTTNEPATPVGANAGGLLAFQPPNPTGCAPGGSGVSTAAISGQIGTLG